MLQDAKGVIRSCKVNKDGQYLGQMTERTNNDLQHTTQKTKEDGQYLGQMTERTNNNIQHTTQKTKEDGQYLG